MGCSESTDSANAPIVPRKLIYPEDESFETEGKEDTPLKVPHKNETPYMPNIQAVSKGILKMGLSLNPSYEINYTSLQKFYSISDGNLNKFFTLIEEKISNLYMELSKETLQKMNSNKLTSTQSKLHIAEQILYTSLNVLKLIGKNTDYNYDPSVLKKFNNLQIAMLGYLKMKYPRGGKSFVPTELMSAFKSFDMVEEPENDLLRSANVYFGEQNQKSLIHDLKKFFNSLIDELDQKFPKFQEFLQEKIFKITDEDRVYSVDYKIGRKIPQTISKFTFEQENFLEIKSPQIFRVIIKWVSDMEDYLLNPTDEVLEKNNFKLVSKTGNLLELDEITPDEVDNLTVVLENNLTALKQEYKEELKTLGQDIELFNHNLIKVLTQVDRKEKFVPRKEAETIKYSMYNTKLLSWMLMQKLVIVMKKLIKVGKEMKNVVSKQMDLIKFNVTDLFRAMITGKKSEIFKVYNNMKAMQEKGLIKIIKIKNRLGTHLNDVMIIFKMKGSYIICELQLILTDGQKAESKKGINVEVLNHFFYELERSPYGVMLQLAVLIGFKDHKVAFQDKITFDSIGLNFRNCEFNHPQKIIRHEIQKKPFICSNCTQYYGPYENQFLLKICVKCNKYLCSKCIIEKQPNLAEKFYLKAMEKSVSIQLQKMDQIQTVRLRKAELNEILEAKKFNDFQNILEIIKFLNFKNLIMLRDINGGKVGKISKKVLKKYIIKNVPGYKSNDFLLCVGHFQGENLNFFSMVWKGGVSDISFGFQLFEKEKDVLFKYNDFLLVIPLVKEKNVLTQINKPENIFKFLRSYENGQISNQENLYYPIQLPNKTIFLLYDKDKANIEKWDQTDSTKIATNTEKDLISNLREKLPDVKQAQENYELSNKGITTPSLIYFKNIEWRNQIKMINLSNNKISDIADLLPYVPNIQKLNISKNKITSIVFPFKLPHLKKFIALSNQIIELRSLEFITSVTTLNLSKNYLRDFNENYYAFNQLKELNLNNNDISTNLSFTDKHYPNLMSLHFSHYTYNYETQTEIQLIKLPKLINFHSSSFWDAKLHFQNCQKLESFKIDHGCLQDVKFITPSLQLKQIYIMNTGVEIKDLLSLQYPQLTSLEIVSGSELERLPLLNIPLIKKLNLSYFRIQDISTLSQSKFQHLESLEMSGNKVVTLPILNLPKVKKIYFNDNHFFDFLDNLSKWNVPMLESLTINEVFSQTFIPELNPETFSNLVQIQIGGGKLGPNYQFKLFKLEKLVLKKIQAKQNLAPMSLPCLKKLRIQDSYVKSLEILGKNNLDCLEELQLLHNLYHPQVNEEEDQKVKKASKDGEQIRVALDFPELNMKKIKKIHIQNFKIKNIDALSKSSLPCIQKIIILGEALSNPLPILNFPTLKVLKVEYSFLKDIMNLENSNFPNLEELSLRQNYFQVVPKLIMPNLVVLDFSYCKIQDLSAFRNSNVEKLQVFNLTGNPVKALSEISMPFITEIDIGQETKSLDFLQRSNLMSLKKLYLRNLELQIGIIPKFQLQNCTDIEIVNTNISDLSNLTNSSIPFLKNLSCNNNMFTSLPVMNLPELDLIKANGQHTSETKKKINNIDNFEFSNLPKLTRLEMEYNDIERLPKIQFPKLKQIFIMNNKIKDISEFIHSNLPNFNLLNIYQNPITIFPLGKKVKPKDIFIKNAKVQDFLSLSSYTSDIFRLHYNQSLIPSELPQLNFPKINRLQFQSCLITNIDNLCKNPFPEIEEISFVNNSITKLPAMICPKLKRFFLNKNKIRDVREFMAGSDLSSVEMLSLEFNQVEDIVDFPFEHPRQIFLSQNPIKDISCMSKYCYINLNMLVVYNCKVAALPKLNAPVCAKIYFNQNLITTQALQQMAGSILPNLNLWQLSNNKIDSLKPLNKINLPALTQLFIQDCYIEELTCLLTCKNLYTFNLKASPLKSIGNFTDVRLQCLQTMSYTLSEELSVEEKEAFIKNMKNCYPYQAECS